MQLGCMPRHTTEHSSGAWTVSLNPATLELSLVLGSRQLTRGCGTERKNEGKGGDMWSDAERQNGTTGPGREVHISSNRHRSPDTASTSLVDKSSTAATSSFRTSAAAWALCRNYRGRES